MLASAERATEAWGLVLGLRHQGKINVDMSNVCYALWQGGKFLYKSVHCTQGAQRYLTSITIKPRERETCWP